MMTKLFCKDKYESIIKSSLLARRAQEQVKKVYHHLRFSTPSQRKEKLLRRGYKEDRWGNMVKREDEKVRKVLLANDNYSIVYWEDEVGRVLHKAGVNWRG